MTSYTITPTGECSVPDKFHKRATPIQYTKYEVILPGTRNKSGGGGCCGGDQMEVTQSKVTFCFSCMSDTRSIGSSTLVGKDLRTSDIQDRPTKSYKKDPGVNCYAFACGRTPDKNGDDPVPGAYFLETKVRAGIVTCKSLKKESTKPMQKFFIRM